MKRYLFHPVHYMLMYMLLFASCTADIDIKTNDSEPVIVIYGVLTNEFIKQSVRISRSSPYFSEEKNAMVSHAVVRIESSQNEQFELIESELNKGVYETTAPMSAQVGVTYRLSVQVDFNGDGAMDTYEAETVMQPAVRIDSILIKPLDIMGENHYALNLYAYDSPEEDYYLCKYLVNDTLKSDRISRYSMIDDDIINGQYVKGLTIQYFNDRKKIDDYKNDDDFDERIFITTGDRITLQMSKVERGYYNFVMECQSEMRGENPFFGGPPSNIRTNISNGGVGYFTAYTVSQSQATAP